MALRLTEAEFANIGGLSIAQKEKRKKFGNKRKFYDSPTIGPHTYQSIWEADLAQMIDGLIIGQQIRTFVIEVPLRLLAVSDSGRHRIARVDFMLIDNYGRSHWWDAKWQATAKWELQRDLVWNQYRIDIKPVQRGKRLPDIYTEDDEGEDDHGQDRHIPMRSMRR